MKIIVFGGDYMVQGNNYGNIYAERKGKVFYLVIGWIAAVISLFRLPFVFGVLGVVMGILSTKGGSRAGLALIITSIALMAIGLFFNGMFYNNIRHFIGF